MVEINTTKLKYSKKEFHGVESDFPFATSYLLVNPTTKGKCVFVFKESTGPEFDPDTKYIYESDDGLKLIVHNQHNTTMVNKFNYIKGKGLSK